MSGDDRYEDHISAVLQECPSVDRDALRSAFQKYEEEFFIPPQDAIRSIIRRFKSETDAQPTATTRTGQSNRQTKKVSRLSELKSDDRDIEIEVEIVSHNVREQMIRGESKSIALVCLKTTLGKREVEREHVGNTKTGATTATLHPVRSFALKEHP